MRKLYRNLQGTDRDEVMRIPVVKLQMAVDGTVEYYREYLNTSRRAAAWVERNFIRGSCREQIIVVCCDASRRATNIDVAGMGSANFCWCAIPELFKAAIISNATGIMVFHNHPSGDPTPSRMDEEVTKKIRKAGEMLDIELIDHIIIGSNGDYYSFMENNRFDGNSDDG